MPARIDRLLEQIDQTLTECDARTLPPLASGMAAAAIDLIEQYADAPLPPWQRQVVVCGLYAEPPVRVTLHETEPPSIGVQIARIVEKAEGERRRTPWWRRWSR